MKKIVLLALVLATVLVSGCSASKAADLQRATASGAAQASQDAQAVQAAQAAQAPCGGTVSAGGSASCAFALNVASAYYYSGGGTTSVQAYSPVTNQTYVMRCESGVPVVCRGGINAVVYIR